MGLGSGFGLGLGVVRKSTVPGQLSQGQLSLGLVLGLAINLPRPGPNPKDYPGICDELTLLRGGHGLNGTGLRLRLGLGLEEGKDKGQG